MGRGLAHIEDGLALQMMRADLLKAHGAPPRSRRRRRCARDPRSGASSISSARRGLVPAVPPRPVLNPSRPSWADQTDRAAGPRLAGSRLFGHDDALDRVAWLSPRFWCREPETAPETGACEEVTGAPVAISFSKMRRVWSAVSAETGASVKRIGAHTARSNIQAGSSSHRVDGSSAPQQWKTSPPLFSITSETRTARPNQGCHR